MHIDTYENLNEIYKRRAIIGSQIDKDTFAKQVRWKSSKQITKRWLKLKVYNNNCISFQLPKVKTAIFVVIVVSFLLFWSCFGIYLSGETMNIKSMSFSLFKSALISLILLHPLFIKPIIFDRMSGFFWKKRIFRRSDSSYKYALSKVHAVQLISKPVFDTYIRKRCYELYVVMKSKERILVVDRLNLKKIKNDASVLAEFLNCPIWERI